MPFQIIRDDITHVQADAIVNPANPNPVIGAGVDRAIHQAAGPRLLAEREKIGRIHFGDAAITPAFDLPAKYVIHAVGPIWNGGDRGEEQLLASCYRKALALAEEKKCRSIAFPLIATGNYGFPKALALQIATQEINRFLLETDMQIDLVVFGKEAFVLSKKLVSSVQSFIDEHYVVAKRDDEYGTADGGLSCAERRRMQDAREEYRMFSANIAGGELPPKGPKDLNDYLRNLDAGFSETLLHLIDLSGKKDAEIYKKANIDRKLFSKIRSKKNYQPSKPTALAFAFALELSLEETQDLIARAGFALSHSSRFDLIVEFFLLQHNYNVMELNQVLFKFDQPLIGA